MTKRQEKALITKSKILDTAADLIKKGEFNNINIENITKACGCAKGTFYIYFKNKEELSFAVCRHLFSQIAVQMNEMQDKSFLCKLEHYFISFMIEVERYDINICREWIKNVIEPKQSASGWDNSKWQFDFAMLQSVLKQAVTDKELKADTPVDLLSHIIISQLYGMMTCWCMSDGVFEPKDWTNKVFKAQVEPMENKNEQNILLQF